jgi:hypothetical protein
MLKGFSYFLLSRAFVSQRGLPSSCSSLPTAASTIQGKFRIAAPKALTMPA